jgi:hypothetical protein
MKSFESEGVQIRPDIPRLERPINHYRSIKPRGVPRSTTPEGLWKRPTYSCPELGRTCFREGAYDAYDLPSIYAGERKPYRFGDAEKSKE